MTRTYRAALIAAQACQLAQVEASVVDVATMGLSQDALRLIVDGRAAHVRQLLHVVQFPAFIGELTSTDRGRRFDVDHSQAAVQVSKALLNRQVFKDVG